MTGAKFRRSGFVVWSCLWTAGGLAGGARPCICAQAGTMERELRTGARAKPPGNPSAWPIRARSGIPHASWDGQVPIPAQIRIGLLVASVHLCSLPSALVSVSPRSTAPAALGYTSADTVPAPRQNDRVHSAPVPAHTWWSARPTVDRRLDRPRAPSSSAASGQPPVVGSPDRAAGAGAWPTHATMRTCAHFP